MGSIARMAERIYRELQVNEAWPQTVSLIGFSDKQAKHLLVDIQSKGYEASLRRTDPTTHELTVHHPPLSHQEQEKFLVDGAEEVLFDEH